MNRRSFAAVAALFAAGATTRDIAAAAAATVEGTVKLEGKAVRMTHATAYLRDNADGWSQQPLVLVFSDRAVPPAALRGWWPPVMKMTEDGQLLGMFVVLDPAKPTYMRVKLLTPQGTGTDFNFNSIDKPLIAGLEVGNDVVKGSLTMKESDNERVVCSLRFAASLARDRPPKVFDGAAARSSPAYAAAATWIKAAAAGNVAVAMATASGKLRENFARDLEDGPARAERAVKSAAQSFARDLAEVQRVVEREDEASLVVNSVSGLKVRREGGEWRFSGDKLQ